MKITGKLIFFAQSGKVLCKLCIKIVDRTRQRSIDRHCETAGHIDRKKSIQKQQSLAIWRKPEIVHSRFWSIPKRELETYENWPEVLFKKFWKKNPNYLSKNFKISGKLLRKSCPNYSNWPENLLLWVPHPLPWVERAFLACNPVLKEDWQNLIKHGDFAAVFIFLCECRMLVIDIFSAYFQRKFWRKWAWFSLKFSMNYCGPWLHQMECAPQKRPLSKTLL